MLSIWIKMDEWVGDFLAGGLPVNILSHKTGSSSVDSEHVVQNVEGTRWPPILNVDKYNTDSWYHIMTEDVAVIGQTTITKPCFSVLKHFKETCRLAWASNN